MKSGLNKEFSLRPLRRIFASLLAPTSHTSCLLVKINVAVKNNNCLRYIFIVTGMMISIASFSQTSDTEYRRPLSDVLEDIKERYNITIRDPESLIQDQTIAYANWKFRPDVEITLSNILNSVDLIAIKEGENKYKIKKYEYHRIPVEEGKQILDSLATRYYDIPSWEKRKNELRACIWEALRLEKLPEKPDSKPIMTEPRIMDGYTVQNVAIEILPGIYVCGSLYKPIEQSSKLAVILCPNGHFSSGRYNESVQIRSAMLAKMGAITFNYDLFGWGEYQNQFEYTDHKKSLAMTIQALNSLRILDYIISLPEADPDRVGITGASAGGSQTMLITALDDRIKVSVPVVMLSCYFYGGCPCESGMPVHLCGGGTNNVELAAMAAPRPQLVISDGGDWSDHVPEIEYPFLQRIYGFYGKEKEVQNVHLPNEGHNNNPSKRFPMYRFMAEQLDLNLEAIVNDQGEIDESSITVEEDTEMYVFGEDGQLLPDNAIKGFEELEKVFENNCEQ